MPDNLLIVVVGKRNSGKSTTWNRLFDKTVHTGKKLRRLDLNGNEFVDVFLVSGSPEERHEYVGDLVGEENPRIVLCSLQYKAEVWKSFQFFFERGYSAIVHWLNPGFSDQAIRQEDDLDLVHHLLQGPTVVGIRNGKLDPTERVRELAEYIAGWARPRGLIRTD